jgi:hypothetical protein
MKGGSQSPELNRSVLRVCTPACKRAGAERPKNKGYPASQPVASRLLMMTGTKSKLAKRNYLMIKLNSIVEYREPFIDEIMDGKPMQYRVVELNDDRCFIEPVNINLSILPKLVAQVKDLKEVE